MQSHGFQKKTIASPVTLGGKLKAKRQKKRLSLAMAEEDTKIRLRYLEAIENDRFNELPFSHRRGFIRRYAKYLSVAYSETDNRDESEAEARSHLFSPSMFKNERQWTITPKVMFAALAALLLLVFVVYISYQISQFSAPPSLTITKPEKDMVAHEETVVLEGTTDPGSNVYVDNLQVTIKSDGSFSYPLILRPGLNKISVQSVNSIKKATNQSISILYQPKEGAGPMPPSPTPVPTSTATAAPPTSTPQL